MADLLRHLPLDVFAEIMLRVPADSLLKLKHVSKPWRALIRELLDDPVFVSRHLTNVKKRKSMTAVFSHQCNGKTERGEQQHSLVTIFHADRFTGLTYPSVTERTDLNDVFGGCGQWRFSLHCDGIVCAHRDTNTFCIFNPILRECRMVQAPSSVAAQGIGFGYGARAKDFKLVRIFPPGSGGKQPEVYSLNDDSWNVIEMPENIPALHISSFKGIYSKGVYYWLVSRDPDSVESILCFDMNDEEFYMMGFPDGDTSLLLEAKINFMVWNNSFAAIFRYGYGRPNVVPKFIDVFTVDSHSKEKHARSWTRQRFAGPHEKLERSFWCLGNGELLMVDENGLPVVYDLHSRKLRGIVVQDFDKFHQGLYVYIESLVSVK